MKTLNSIQFNSIQFNSIRLFLSYLIFLNLLFTQNSIGQCGNTIYTISGLPGGGIQDGPRYVNLYVHAIRYDDCSGGPTLSQIGLALDNLNTAFNPHDIWFNVVCIDEICSSLSYTNNCIIPTLYTSHSNQNGLNLYLTVGDNEPSCELSGQSEFPLPSKNCWAAYYNHIPTHEIGHCLGLDHTFIGNECVTRDPNNSNYNCEVEGDGFCNSSNGQKWNGCSIL